MSPFGPSPRPCKWIDANLINLPLSIIPFITDLNLLSVPTIALYKMHIYLSTKLRCYCLFSDVAMSCTGAVMGTKLVMEHLPVICCSPLQHTGIRLFIRSPQSSESVSQLSQIVGYRVFFAITASALYVFNALIPMDWIHMPSDVFTPQTSKS